MELQKNITKAAGCQGKSELLNRYNSTQTVNSMPQADEKLVHSSQSMIRLKYY